MPTKGNRTFGRNELLKLAHRFRFGQKLAIEAINHHFPTAEKRIVVKKHKHFECGNPDSSRDLVYQLNSWSQWKSSKWLYRVKDVREGLMALIAPEITVRYAKDDFKLTGRRAYEFGDEVLKFVITFCSKRKRSRNAAPKEGEAEACIYALETMIIGSWVDARRRKNWIQHLVELCRANCMMPKTLHITDIKFNSPHAIACGGSADVYLAAVGDNVEDEVEEVVVKYLQFYRANEVNKKRKIWGPLHEEALNWLGLDHPAINPFLGITYEHPQGRNDIGLVFKYQKEGNVNKHLDTAKESDRIIFMQSKFVHIVGAINFLHEMDLVHGDIKGCNILIGEDTQPLLTDFGLMRRMATQCASEKPASITASTESSDTSTHSSGDFTLRWASKERVMEGLRTKEDDIWALGMTMIELLTGKEPLKRLHEPVFLSDLCRGLIEMIPEDVPANARAEFFDCIKKCLSNEPAERPSAFELYTIMSNVAGTWALGDMMS